jgi:hypothetical protein
MTIHAAPSLNHAVTVDLEHSRDSPLGQPFHQLKHVHSRPSGKIIASPESAPLGRLWAVRGRPRPTNDD